MTKQHKATPDDWAQQEDWANRRVFSDNSCIIELRDRVEALEAAQQPLAFTGKVVAPITRDRDETGDYLIVHDTPAPAALAQPEPEGPPMPVPGDAEGLAEVFWGRHDQPEPAAPTDEELNELKHDYWWLDANHSKPWIPFARAVLARYARPAIEPVPVSERLPEVGDWVWHCYVGVRFWKHGRYNGRQFFIGDGPESQPATHWLPANALPTPEATNA
jgi:hypothetical protein